MTNENSSKYLSEELVSIIMPAFNCAEFIGTTIESVISQTYTNWELIIVDDCSTDNTPKIIKEYMLKEMRIKYNRLMKNSGAAISRNKAIELAGGKYLAFLDSDDVWFPEKLAKQIGFMKENEYKFTCTSYAKIDESGNHLDQVIKTQKLRDYEGILKDCPGNSTVIYDADMLGKFKIPNIKKRNDYVMWLKIVKQAEYLHGLDEVLGAHRIRSGGLSSNKISLIGYHWKVYRRYEKLPVTKSIYLICYWVLSTIFKLRKSTVGGNYENI